MGADLELGEPSEWQGEVVIVGEADKEEVGERDACLDSEGGQRPPTLCNACLADAGPRSPQLEPPQRPPDIQPTTCWQSLPRSTNPQGPN